MELYEPGYMQLLILIPFIVVAILFFLTQQRTLNMIRPENRCMTPGLVWLQLIPLFGLGWQFYVVIKISDSIRKELNTPADDSIFAEEIIPSMNRPTYKAGILYCTLICISVLPLPFIKSLAALAGLVAWINYWAVLSGYKKQLKERALLLNSRS